MRFDLDADQRAIRDTARELCRARFDGSPPPDDPDAHDEFWPALASSEFTQLAVPRRFGGDAGGVLELCLVLEELGYALAPGAFFANACAGVVLAAAGEEPSRDPLAGIASGERRAAFGVQRDGEAALLLGVHGATSFVVVGDAAVTCAGVTDAERAPALDVTRTFHRAATLPDARHIRGDAAHARDCAEMLVAADLVGVAQHAMELAVSYATERQQFGRPIGAYQAVSHRCADMLVAVESARSAMLAAAWTADNEPDALPFAASTAKVAAAHAAWSVSTSSLQVHGGIGFTFEHPIHRFLRRAAVSARLLGSTQQHLDRVAALSGLPAGA